MRDHAMAHEGLVIFHMDPRSASGKGAVSTWTAYKHLGVQETKDIEDAINWLKQKPYVDGVADRHERAQLRRLHHVVRDDPLRTCSPRGSPARR